MDAAPHAAFEQDVQAANAPARGLFFLVNATMLHEVFLWASKEKVGLNAKESKNHLFYLTRKISPSAPSQ